MMMTAIVKGSTLHRFGAGFFAGLDPTDQTKRMSIIELDSDGIKSVVTKHERWLPHRGTAIHDAGEHGVLRTGGDVAHGKFEHLLVHELRVASQRRRIPRLRCVADERDGIRQSACHRVPRHGRVDRNRSGE